VIVPLLDLKAQYAPLRDELRAVVDEVMDSQHFILGPEVTALEREVAAFVGASHGIGMSSGTDALLAALMALDIGPGDEVVTTPFTFFATAGVVSRLGATPVFVDIDPATYNIDPRAAADAVTDRTKAIVPVHLYGRCADVQGIERELAGRAIPIVEDAAQAIGAFDERDRRAGELGVMACYSFFPSKNLGGFGDGGMVTTDDDGLAKKLRTLRVHGSNPKYYHQVIGGNFRLDALQAAVLRVKLKHLPAWTEARRSNADRYRALFAEAGLVDRLTLPADVPGHIYNQFVIRVPQRDAVRDHLKARGVGTEIYYPLPLHLQDCYRSLGYAPGDLPHAEKAANEVLALPIYPELGEDQLAHVVASVAEALHASSENVMAPALS
jgi:dTDP-4-amino-4,6-dideoxygalactose transaminase